MSRLAKDVLRYWAAVLRQEEALAVRPRARRGQPRPSASPLASPAAGQDYTKLPLAEHESFLLHGVSNVELEQTPEQAAFFEDWLLKQYKSGLDEGRMAHLIAFPTILLPRDELAGVLRFAVDLEWRHGSARFQPPNPRARAQGSLPPPPTSLKVQRSQRTDEDALPYFIDTKLLRDVLRVDAERLDAFVAQAKDKNLAAAPMVQALCQMLEQQLAQDSAAPANCPGPLEGAPLLARLQQLTGQRLQTLQSRSRVFPVALLLDASRNRTTFHVQRDLEASLDRLSSDGFHANAPLMLYLGARGSAPTARGNIVGRWQTGLTDSQRQAADLFLGSKLCAVQGPPGTGKTHVILNLAAHQLIENFAPLQRIKQPQPNLLMVTSTNNRAVDNVLGPLGQDLPAAQLPLALRVGSRDVVEKVTQAELMRAARWLDAAPPASEELLKAATERFAAVSERVQTRLEPLQKQLSSELALERARYQLELLETALGQQSDDALEQLLEQLNTNIKAEQLLELEGLTGALEALAIRLRTLSGLAEGAVLIALLEQHFVTTSREQLNKVNQLMGSTLQLGLPPTRSDGAPQPEQREAWEEAAEDALGKVLALKEAISARHERAWQLQELDRLRRQVQELTSDASRAKDEAPPPVDWQASEREQAELFHAAIELRETWARLNKKPLGAALEQAIQISKRTKSLRGLLDSKKGPGIWLRRLYPVWGCTLLSLGNNFGVEDNGFARVVIDEAGQCHPAYATSALLRAESALVIGDVHQLEPVVELNRQDEERVLRGLKLRSSMRSLAPYRMFQGAEASAQSVADRAVRRRPTLIDHFRCQKEIASLCDELCDYGLRTHTPERSRRDLLDELSHPLLHVPVAGQQTRFSGSWTNQSEVQAVTHWLERLLRAGVLPNEIAVITPFRGQLESLWRELRQAKIPLERATPIDELDQISLFGSQQEGVALGTVHRFQGGERSVVLLSTTVTEPRSLPFLDARVNMVNVAVSRAKEHLITVGHTATLKLGKHTAPLVKRARVPASSLTNHSS